jgi:hypothetical protein
VQSHSLCTANRSIAKPSADAPLYRKGQVVLPAASRQEPVPTAKAGGAQRRTASVVPVVPAVNAWQKPLRAALQPAVAAASAEGHQQQPREQQPHHQEQHPLAPPPHPPSILFKQQEGDAAVAAAAAVTPEPLQALALLHIDTPLLEGGNGGLGWNPIGSGLGASAVSALASAGSSRATTPAPGGGGGGAAAAAAAAAGQPWLGPQAEQTSFSLFGAGGGEQGLDAFGMFGSGIFQPQTAPETAACVWVTTAASDMGEEGHFVGGDLWADINM